MAEKLSWNKIAKECEENGIDSPISLMFLKCIGRVPELEELRKYISIVCMPTNNSSIFEMQKRELGMMIKRNNRLLGNGEWNGWA